MESLRALEVRPRWTGVEIPKLDPPRRVLESLGNPQNQVPAVHIAGTNGKGTVAAILAAIFQTSGARVGQLLSPHLQEVNERLLVDGQPISAELLGNALSKIEPIEAEEKLKLSYFEAVIVASHILCAELKLDWAVVEVGLGGRLDATNLMVAPKATVITSIGLDHIEVLGDTEEQIAYEKAGIFRPRVPAIVGPVSPAAMSSIESYAQRIGTSVEAFGDAYWLDGDCVCSREGWRFVLPVADLKLLARYQRENFAVAAFTAHRLGFDNSTIESGMRHMRWPGRVEEANLVRSEKVLPMLLDGAHNLEGVAGLIDYLTRVDAKELFLLIAILKNKDFSAMGKILTQWAKTSAKPVHFHFCPMEYPGCAAPEKLREAFGTGQISASKEEALDKIAAEANSEDLIVVTGSLYFVGEVRPLVVHDPFRTFI